MFVYILIGAAIVPLNKENLEAMLLGNSNLSLNQYRISVQKQYTSVIRQVTKSSASPDLKELMTYPLTLVPDCTDGFLAKNEKSKGSHFLTADGGEQKETKGLLTFLSTADNKKTTHFCLAESMGIRPVCI